MEKEIISLIYLGALIIPTLCFTMYMVYLEEKRKCKHSWVETNRLTGYNGWGSVVTDVHLRCNKCGDVKKRTL